MAFLGGGHPELSTLTSWQFWMSTG